MYYVHLQLAAQKQALLKQKQAMAAKKSGTITAAAKPVPSLFTLEEDEGNAALDKDHSEHGNNHAHTSATVIRHHVGKPTITTSAAAAPTTAVTSTQASAVATSDLAAAAASQTVTDSSIAPPTAAQPPTAPTLPERKPSLQCFCDVFCASSQSTHAEVSTSLFVRSVALCPVTPVHVLAAPVSEEVTRAIHNLVNFIAKSGPQFENVQSIAYHSHSAVYCSATACAQRHSSLS